MGGTSRDVLQHFVRVFVPGEENAGYRAAGAGVISYYTDTRLLRRILIASSCSRSVCPREVWYASTKKTTNEGTCRKEFMGSVPLPTFLHQIKRWVLSRR